MASMPAPWVRPWTCHPGLEPLAHSNNTSKTSEERRVPTSLILSNRAEICQEGRRNCP